MAHSRSGVATKPAKSENGLQLPNNPRQFVLLPAIARKNYKLLLGNQANMEAISEESSFNQYFDAPNKKLGIIATGISYNYLMENLAVPRCFVEPIWMDFFG